VEFAGIQKGGRVIDVGCGTGSMVQAISTWDSTARITGIDPVQAFIDYRRPLGDPRIAFQRGSARTTLSGRPFRPCTIASRADVHPHADKAAREMRRVTKPGGTVAACTWDAQGFEDGQHLYEDQAGSDCETKADRLRQLNHRGQLADLWTRIGLRNVAESAIEIFEWTSSPSITDSSHGRAGPPRAYISTAHPAPDKLKERVREKLLANQPDGPFAPAKASGSPRHGARVGHLAGNAVAKSGRTGCGKYKVIIAPPPAMLTARTLAADWRAKP
jgi:SAM-dependent methyltransferase